MKLIKLSIILIIAFIVVSACSAVSAQTESTPQAKTKVDHLSGIIDKIGEKIGLFLKFNNEDKLNYQQQILEKRMGELEYVINNGQGDLIEEMSSRYGTYLGNFSDFAVNNKITDKKEQLIILYDDHIQLLTYFQQKVGVDTGWYILLQHNINVANQYKIKIQEL